MKLFDKETDRMLGMPLPFFMIAVLLLGFVFVIPIVLSPKTTTITTKPAGASVYAKPFLSIGGERQLCEATPCEVSFNRFQKRLVLIELLGHRPFQILLDPVQPMWDRAFQRPITLYPMPQIPNTALAVSACDTQIAQLDYPGATEPVAEATPCHRSPPFIPPRAKRSGHCHVVFTIDREGRPQELDVRGCTENVFQTAAYEAVKGWRYYPQREDGQVVARAGVVSKLSFRLSDKDGEVIPELSFDPTDPDHMGDLADQE